MHEPASSPLLSLFEVKKSYRIGAQDVPALHAVSFSVERGNFLMLQGPSGCGKTTLLNLIGCLDQPDGGSIEIASVLVNKLSEKEKTRFRRQKIGFVFQSFNLIPVLSAQENVEYPLRLMGLSSRERRLKAQACLEHVGLQGLFQRRPDELSGGQQQRVAIARALVKDPLLVLADEPTAHLDSQTGEDIVSLMEEMQRQKGITFIVSTHDKALLKHANTVLSMQDGRIEASSVLYERVG